MPPILNPTALPLAENVDTRSARQIECEDVKGGKWDFENKTCILPETEIPADDPALKNQSFPTDEPVVSDPVPTVPETFVDSETGEPSGVVIDGETFLGVNASDIQKIVAADTREKAKLAGTAPVGTARLAQEEITRKLVLARNVGQIDFELASQLEEQGINVRELLSAGGQNVDLKIPALAIASGFSTAPATAGISVAGGFAVAGGSIINDFQKGVRRNIKDQREDLVTLKTKELKQRQRAMNNYIQAANMNPATADDFVAAYNIEKSLIRRDYNTLVKKGNEDLEFWGSDATRQIADYDVFFDSVEPSLDIRMTQAVLKPEPSRAFLSIEDEDEF